MYSVFDFIVGNALPDIEYSTNPPVETIVPRLAVRNGIPMVYIHKERQETNRGFVTIEVFLQRLARREPGLMATGYRNSGKQTTISFNKWERVKISPKLQSYLSALSTDAFVPSPSSAAVSEPRKASSVAQHRSLSPKSISPRKITSGMKLMARLPIRMADYCCQGASLTLSAGPFALDELNIAKYGDRTLRFSPLGNRPASPRIALVGITPGGQSERFAEYLGSMSVEEAAKRAAFEGKQTEIKKLLAAHGLAQHMSLSLDGDLNDNPDVFTTSLVKCCLMVNGDYRFKAPDIVASPEATHCVSKRFVGDINSYPTLQWVVVFGEPGWDAIHQLRYNGKPIVGFFRERGLVVLNLPHFAQNFQQRELFLSDPSEEDRLLELKPKFRGYAAKARKMRDAVLHEIADGK